MLSLGLMPFLKLEAGFFDDTWDYVKGKAEKVSDTAKKEWNNISSNVSKFYSETGKPFTDVVTDNQKWDIEKIFGKDLNHKYVFRREVGSGDDKKYVLDYVEEKKFGSFRPPKKKEDAIFECYDLKKYSKWLVPSGEIRLNEATFLGTHNSFSHKRIFSVLPSHFANWAEQLDLGVRVFLPDVYWCDNQVKMCHANCNNARARFETGTPLGEIKHETFKFMLEIMADWLRRNKDEILIFILENEASIKQIEDVIKSVPEFEKMILKTIDKDPKTVDKNEVYDWNLHVKGGAWPLIKWMREQNKRVVIFNYSGKESIYMRSRFGYARTAEMMKREAFNVSSSNFKDLAYKSDKEHRKFYFVEYYMHPEPIFMDCVELYKYDNMKKLLREAREKRRNTTWKNDKGETIATKASGDRMPNVIVIDRPSAVGVLAKQNKKSVMDLINEMNGASYNYYHQKNVDLRGADVITPGEGSFYFKK